MPTTTAPFSSEHLEPAAALLAARHRQDRVWTPELSPAYEDPAATLPIVRDLLATDGTSGVVAMCEGNVAAYLLGTPDLGSPTRAFAGFSQPRAIEIPYGGHAVDPDGGATLSRGSTPRSLSNG